MSAPETDSGPAAEPVVVEPKHPLEDPRPLGVHILTWLAWFWTGAVLLFLLSFGFGQGPVPMAGETLTRADALGRVLPMLVPTGLAALGAALALSLRRHWARPAVLLPVFLAALGPALSGTGTMGDLVTGALMALPIVAVLVWYLYFVEGVKAYFADLRDPGEPG